MPGAASALRLSVVRSLRLRVPTWLEHCDASENRVSVANRSLWKTKLGVDRPSRLGAGWRSGLGVEKPSLYESRNARKGSLGSARLWLVGFLAVWNLCINGESSELEAEGIPEKRLFSGRTSHVRPYRASSILLSLYFVSN
ncbi:hypothetical protein Bbelb_337050 [Branchiostoma belcheri]|nr:hypothetical protein Bbelb_337050 [Branchiostoma belcheri]